MKNEPTKRETQVAGLIAYGYVDKEVANALHISPETVRTHRKRYYEKTGCRNSADLTRHYLSRAFNVSFKINDITKKILATVFVFGAGLCAALNLNLSHLATYLQTVNFKPMHTTEHLKNMAIEMGITYLVLALIIALIVWAKLRYEKRENDHPFNSKY